MTKAARRGSVDEEASRRLLLRKGRSARSKKWKVRYCF
jgi:hypothetical protein